MVLGVLLDKGAGAQPLAQTIIGVGSEVWRIWCGLRRTRMTEVFLDREMLRENMAWEDGAAAVQGFQRHERCKLFCGLTGSRCGAAHATKDPESAHGEAQGLRGRLHSFGQRFARTYPGAGGKGHGQLV